MKKRKLFFLAIKILLLIVVTCSCQKAGEQIPWINLINDNNLEGWNIKGGNASYKNENGTIIGTTASNTPNTFLCTDKCMVILFLKLNTR